MSREACLIVVKDGLEIFNVSLAKLLVNTGGCFTIGRDATCTIRLDHISCSRRHGQFSWQNDSLCYMDYSTHGTFIIEEKGRSQRVPSAVWMRLRSADHIQLGASTRQLSFKNLEELPLELVYAASKAKQTKRLASNKSNSIREEGNTLAAEILPEFLRGPTHHATPSYEPVEKRKDLPEKAEVTLIDLTDAKVLCDVGSSASLPQSPELISLTDSPERETDSCLDSTSVCSLESESPLDILEPDYEVIDVESHAEKSDHSNTVLSGAQDDSYNIELKAKEDANVTADQMSTKEALQEIVEIGNNSEPEEASKTPKANGSDQEVEVQNEVKQKEAEEYVEVESQDEEDSSQENTALKRKMCQCAAVVDTNIFLDIQCFAKLVKLVDRRCLCKICIIVPRIVLRELDKLNHRGPNTMKCQITNIFRMLEAEQAGNSGLKPSVIHLQKLDEPENDDAAFIANHARERQHWNNDDYVMEAAHFFQKSGRFCQTVLITNDRLLRVWARSEGLRAESGTFGLDNLLETCSNESEYARQEPLPEVVQTITFSAQENCKLKLKPKSKSRRGKKRQKWDVPFKWNLPNMPLGWDLNSQGIEDNPIPYFPGSQNVNPYQPVQLNQQKGQENWAPMANMFAGFSAISLNDKNMHLHQYNTRMQPKIPQNIFLPQMANQNWLSSSSNKFSRR